MNPDRVYFFSKYDGASFNHLEKADKILVNFDKNKNYDINDIIEFYQIKLYIDNGLYLSKWSNEDISNIKNKVDEIWELIVSFWNSINSNNIIDLFSKLECWTIQESFWKLTINLSVYKKITKEIFATLLRIEDIDIRAVLYQEKLVNYYSKEIKEFLLSYLETAELLLSQYVEKHNYDRKDLFFPKCLSLTEREKLILQYLDSENPNINYVRLIINIKNDNNNLQIADKTRLKAKKIEKKLNDDFFSNNKTIYFGYKIIFDDEQTEPIKYSKEKELQILSYSTQYITKINDPFYHFFLLNSLFHFLNEQGCINLVSNVCDLEVLEKISVSSKNEYPTGIVFNRKAKLSFMQIFMYDKLLIERQKQSIENLLEYIIVDFFSDKLSLIGFKFNIPSIGTNYLEKIRTLLAEYDGLLKQYKLYRDNGEIDFELFQLTSSSYNLCEIKSFVTKKYCYLKNDKLDSILFLLFSDQSHLTYVEPFKQANYICLYDLIINENVLYENYKSYQIGDLNHLFDSGYLLLDHNGYIILRNIHKTFLLSKLYKEEVLNYWHYKKEYRNIIDDMVKADLLYFEDTLFTKMEQDYFNYYLNKKKFTNGIDLRNSFMHGTNPNSEEKLINMYYVLIRIIVLTVLKMIDDQLLKPKYEYNFYQE